MQRYDRRAATPSTNDLPNVPEHAVPHWNRTCSEIRCIARRTTADAGIDPALFLDSLSKQQDGFLPDGFLDEVATSPLLPSNASETTMAELLAPPGVASSTPGGERATRKRKRKSDEAAEERGGGIESYRCFGAGDNRIEDEAETLEVDLCMQVGEAKRGNEVGKGVALGLLRL